MDWKVASAVAGLDMPSKFQAAMDWAWPVLGAPATAIAKRKKMAGIFFTGGSGVDLERGSSGMSAIFHPGFVRATGNNVKPFT